MSTTRTSVHGQWSSRLAFILAATGSAVGLGNIWKFPYITGENGGGAFVLVYLVCIGLIGIPIMMAEVLIGRRGRQSPINTMMTLAKEEKLSKVWALLGWSGVLAGVLILSYYSVIAGWAMSYIFRAGSGAFVGVTAEGVSSIFSALISDPERLLAWHTLFMVMTLIVVARGVRSGLELAVRYLIPLLFVLLFLLVGYAYTTGHFGEALEFLFKPDFSKLSAESVLIAMGHAFFTLSLGMGAIMVYGSYLPANVSIARTSIIIAVLDTLVALLAGMAIFPIVFANGLEPGSGPGLIFETLPIAFGHMSFGTLFGVLFFLLLSFAAWTSAISLIEPAVAWLVENRNMTRVQSTIWCGVVVWLVGLGSVFSFNLWSEFRPLGMFPVFADKNFFDVLDFITSNVMLPLGGLLIAVFAAWRLSRSTSFDELKMGDGLAYPLWRFLVRYITPIAVLIVFLDALGILPDF
ncbi:MAG TPA: sodium-dependent transporter [Chromatiaceae bacterium]|jgi:NSS family neurotransmitter:Na+ symporter|nr:sodium-dependent transporter [Chromatiaceae bacterium]HIB85000.1 sodium-dependent transporter [Chromatiaceae bacterium]HIN81533.1 sodium-dependent transporter [Chromatiales bacterium]HIO14420.1 sodium-dependent transporter [Chromatiales bacterium]HIO54321.1 sodium-dependent transporter [Chromatiales bacterium]